MKKQINQPSKAVIYCRVSSERQVREGDGLNSQEKICREHAKNLNASVDKVFKDEGISGAASDRPAFKKMLAFLDTKKEPYFVIVYDVKRLARGMKAYIEIATQLKKRKSVLSSPTHNFGDTPGEEFVTDMLVCAASYERAANREQVINRQKARLENGFWPFFAPLGYRHVKADAGGKVLMRVEPMATVISDAFKSFAAGRFETQADIANFFARSGVFVLNKKGEFHPSRVKAILTNVLYAGYIEFADWGVELRQGQHPPITDMQTFHKVQERLGLKAKAPYRKDLREDFPLRGFVLCAKCDGALTSGWSTARNGRKHPYYHCKQRGCPLYGKTIRRDLIEGKLDELLRSIAPSKAVLELAEEMTRDIHQKLKKEHANLRHRLNREVGDIENQKQGIMNRLLTTEDPSMIRLYEGHVKKLEEKRQGLMEEAVQAAGTDTGLKAALGTVFEFLGNPHALWGNGDLEDKRLVLKMTFAKKLSFDRESGFGTTLTSLPFTVFSSLAAKKSVMVEGGGFEPPYS